MGANLRKEKSRPHPPSPSPKEKERCGKSLMIYITTTSAFDLYSPIFKRPDFIMLYEKRGL
jgi:hypothetical protein